MVLALSHDRRRLPRSGKDAQRLVLGGGAAGTMLLENDAPIRLLLVMTQAGVAEMVSVGAIVVAAAAAPVMVLLVRTLLRVGGVAARPVTESYVAHRHKEGTAFGTGEEPTTFVGPVANSLTCS